MRRFRTIIVSGSSRVAKRREGPYARVMTAAFSAAIESIPRDMQTAMRGTSWHAHPRCPTMADLALVRVTHWDMNERVQTGELVVARSIGDEVVGVFRHLYDARFPLTKIVPICRYGGDDDASMADNNCSAFNFRTIAGSDNLSVHALGLAIDINPVQNPWVKPGVVLPAAGRSYLDRSEIRPGMIARPGPVTDAFDALGWTWGGDWPDMQDYHHFQKISTRGANTPT